MNLSRLEIGFLLRFNVLCTVSNVLSSGESVTYDPAEDWLRVELSGAELDLALSGRKCRRSVMNSYHCVLHSHDVTMLGVYFDVWVCLQHFDVIAKVYRTVTLNFYDLCVGLSYF